MNYNKFILLKTFLSIFGSVNAVWMYFLSAQSLFVKHSFFYTVVMRRRQHGRIFSIDQGLRK